MRNSLPHGSRHAFTLMEMMVVIIALGAITAIALPNYNRSVAIARERRALNNLYLIHDAEKSSSIPAGSTYNLSQINTNLALNILADGDVYQCQFNNPNVYTCTVQFHSGAYQLTLTGDPVDTTDNPCCSAGACPLTPAC